MHSRFILKRQLKFNVETDNLCTLSLLFHSKIDRKGDHQQCHVHDPSALDSTVYSEKFCSMLKIGSWYTSPKNPLSVTFLLKGVLISQRSGEL